MCALFFCISFCAFLVMQNLFGLRKNIEIWEPGALLILDLITLLVSR